MVVGEEPQYLKVKVVGFDEVLYAKNEFYVKIHMDGLEVFAKFS